MYPPFFPSTVVQEPHLCVLTALLIFTITRSIFLPNIRNYSDKIARVIISTRIEKTLESAVVFGDKKKILFVFWNDTTCCVYVKKNKLNTNEKRPWKIIATTVGYTNDPDRLTVINPWCFDVD